MCYQYVTKGRGDTPTYIVLSYLIIVYKHFFPKSYNVVPYNFFLKTKSKISKYFRKLGKIPEN